MQDAVELAETQCHGFLTGAQDVDWPRVKAQADDGPGTGFDPFGFLIQGAEVSQTTLRLGAA